GLADGYFVLPYTIGQFLSSQIRVSKFSNDTEEFTAAIKAVKDRQTKLINIKGNEPVEHYHRELGLLMWNYCGMSRNADGLKKARKEIGALREEFWKNVYIPGTSDEFNPELDKAQRVADFFELAELMTVDALDRNESCGGHFREEYRTEEGEAARNDKDYAYVSAWEFNGVGADPTLHKEELTFENVELKTRSYK
ncbi:MAG: fumarate reductase/succinate dehydrogenase flavoprotein subunit, partial [Bacteroidota bacterium]